MAGAMAPRSSGAARAVGAVSSPSVTVRQVPRALEHDPEIRVEFERGGGGTMSEISWGNASVLRALRTLFGCRADEKLSAVVITSRGIKAEFRRG
jgi:hypothetical protein